MTIQPRFEFLKVIVFCHRSLLFGAAADVLRWAKLGTAVKAKVENKGQYDEYVRDLAPLREELGVNLKEELYPEPWQ